MLSGAGRVVPYVDNRNENGIYIARISLFLSKLVGGNEVILAAVNDAKDKETHSRQQFAVSP